MTQNPLHNPDKAARGSSPLTLCAIVMLLMPGWLGAETRLDLDTDAVRSFVSKMVDEHGFEAIELRQLLADARVQQPILDAISRPAERALSWDEYRAIFITEARIDRGVAFYHDNAETVRAVAKRTGVPAEMLVAIVGVETFYGRIMGRYRVLDSLSTLAFAYPPRGRFFTSELEHFFLLTREEALDPSEPLGSYAGAMGAAQFIPSSYRSYAVDESADGKRDLWNDWSDVLGSIANYFVSHGWQSGRPVAAQATLGSRWQGPLPKNTLKLNTTVATLSEQGYVFSTELPPDNRAMLVRLERADDPGVWVGFKNFHVITRYNRSVMYAMAVYQLAQFIADGVDQES